jgi:peptidoglycan/xylan/chitin deacetylase (PgdA/CDA1 family)
LVKDGKMPIARNPPLKKSLVWFGIIFSLAAVSPFAASQGQQVAGSLPAAKPAKALRPRKLSAHPVIALTFDDMPAAGSLPPGGNRTKVATDLAAELKAAGLNGVYGFVNGNKLENDPDAQRALRIWMDAGMKIGNHTWSHPSLADLSVEAYEREIARNEPALAKYAGEQDWHWFRYPYLVEGDTAEKYNAVRGWLLGHGYRVAEVTLNFEDYTWNDAYGRCTGKKDGAALAWLRQSYLASAAEYVKLGREEEQISFGHEIPNVILLHATAFTTLMLPDLIDLLQKQGFRFASLAKVEGNAAYRKAPAAGSKYNGTLPDQFMDLRHLPYPPFPPLPTEKLQSICK